MLPSELLSEGWIQGALWNLARTRFCILGAIEVTPHPIQLFKAIHREIQKTGYRYRIATWNDEADRTQAEVVGLVRRAEIACGLCPEDSPEQWEIPVQPVEAEPVLVESK